MLQIQARFYGTLTRSHPPTRTWKLLYCIVRTRAGPRVEEIKSLHTFSARRTPVALSYMVVSRTGMYKGQIRDGSTLTYDPERKYGAITGKSGITWDGPGQEA